MATSRTGDASSEIVSLTDVFHSVSQTATHLTSNLKDIQEHKSKINGSVAADDVMHKCRLVHTGSFVSLPYLLTRGLWGTMTRVIKIYKCEARLSIKLTSCPCPALLQGELHQTPENPWPFSDWEPRGKLGDMGWDRLGLWWSAAAAGNLEKQVLTEMLDGFESSDVEILRWEEWISSAVSHSAAVKVIHHFQSELASYASVLVLLMTFLGCPF